VPIFCFKQLAVVTGMALFLSALMKRESRQARKDFFKTEGLVASPYDLLPIKIIPLFTESCFYCCILFCYQLTAGVIRSV
jgi:hypothetical protein